MYYQDMNPDLKSSFLKTHTNTANLVDDSQLPIFGLKARNLLDDKQMHKLAKIRNKHLSQKTQRDQFYKD